MKIHLIQKSRPKADGSFPILLDIADSNERVRVTTGIDAITKLRGYELGRAEPNWKAKSDFLHRLLLRAETIQLENPKITAKELCDELMEEIYGKTKQPESTLLVEVLARFAETKEGRSREHYLYTMRKVEGYDSRVDIARVNKKWIEGFDEHCADMSINGKATHHRHLRAALNWAIEEGWIKENPYMRFKIKTERTRKRYLTIEQLRAIRDMKCEGWQEIYRDLFMLTFYLIGINAKDLLMLTKENLVGDRIEYTRAKTKKLYSVKVEPEAQAIIDKWRGGNYLLYPMDRYTSHLDFLSHWNKALKGLGKVHRNGVKSEGKPIAEGLSTYWARHTWASMAVELDIPVDIVAHALGHSIPTFSVTETYIFRDRKKVDMANRKVLDYLAEA